MNDISGLPENHYWRYNQNLYAMFARLRDRFPKVIFENCASGGARTDLGTVPLLDHTWVTDWHLAPRSFAITDGMTMALPPELVDRHVGAGMNDHLRGDIDFQCRLALFGRPTVGWRHPVGTNSSAAQVDRVRHMITLYKEFVRPWQADGRISIEHGRGTLRNALEKAHGENLDLRRELARRGTGTIHHTAHVASIATTT